MHTMHYKGTRGGRIRWRTVLLAVAIVIAVAAVAGGVLYHLYWPTHRHYPDVQFTRLVQQGDPRAEDEEAYAEWIGASWPGNEKTDKKMREFSLWNHGVDLEIHYFYTAPYHIEISGEVKGGKTTLRYTGHVTTQDGQTIDYNNEMTFDFAYGPEGPVEWKESL